jgi:hypothetical protein
MNSPFKEITDHFNNNRTYLRDNNGAVNREPFVVIDLSKNNCLLLISNWIFVKRTDFGTFFSTMSC